MRASLLVLISCLCMFANAKKLEVAVYYESLCPDSVRFITKQLHPSFKDVEKYLDLDLVPFGFATADHSSGHWEFECQHGPLECFFNKVHSCIIASNAIMPSEEFVNCAMSSRSKSNNSLITCANETNVPWNPIKKCLESGEADELLVKNGKKTKSVTPPIDYIPTIIFNGTYSKPLQDGAEKHFLKVVCQLLENEPDICKSVGVLLDLII